MKYQRLNIFGEKAEKRVTRVAAVFVMLLALVPLASHAEIARVPDLEVSAPVRARCGSLATGFRQTGGCAGDRFPWPYGPLQGKLDPHLAEFLAGCLDFAFLIREISEADLSTFRRYCAGMDPPAVPVAGGSRNRFGFVDAIKVIVNASHPPQALDSER